MATVLYINGTAIGRYGVVLNQFSTSMDGPDTLAFTQLATRLPGQFRQGQSAVLSVDGTVVFIGQIVSLHPSGVNRGPINIGYRALGLNWLCNQVWTTGTDGSGKIVFNLPETDPAYVASMSGLNVGQILSYLYTLHATQLTAAGITAFNSTDLSVLTIVPPDPVVCTGRLWNAVQSLMMTYYNSYGSWIAPGGTTSPWALTGTIRHENLLTLPNGTSAPVTFTLDQLDGSSIPCVLESISEDFSECYTQVIIRGYDNIQGAYLSLHDGTLTWAQSSAQQTAWNYQTYITPPGGLAGHVDAMKFLPHIPQSQYPAGCLASAIYIASGARPMERGTVSMDRDKNGNDVFSDIELARLAVPRRVYSMAHIDYVVDRLKWLMENRKLVGGLKFIEEPPVLRFFFGRLAALNDWGRKLTEAFEADFGKEY